ncbi:MAG TPA: tRNA (N6-isopentenyl adenosine(37)-C2)-methylthiotransferase MiaB, partial [Alphaproteobacteria bacterium]|nr:tRNA (N6-isopentenyl adenosine(37)-C2)-methylthiotransferase MiaB [Alphaproteobacteria bacterium]
LDELLALLRVQQEAFWRSCVGRTMDVLFERKGRYAGQLVGRSPFLQGVHADAPESLIGQIAPVRIEEARTNSLLGALVSPCHGEAA